MHQIHHARSEMLPQPFLHIRTGRSSLEAYSKQWANLNKRKPPRGVPVPFLKARKGLAHDVKWPYWNITNKRIEVCPLHPLYAFTIWYLNIAEAFKIRIQLQESTRRDALRVGLTNPEVPKWPKVIKFII